MPGLHDLEALVRDFLDTEYKADRLNRPGGTREHLIADRLGDLKQYGSAFISRHDSNRGLPVKLFPDGRVEVG